VRRTTARQSIETASFRCRAQRSATRHPKRQKHTARNFNPRTFSAENAEKIRHPREFQSCRGSLRCRAEGSATRRARRISNRGESSRTSKPAPFKNRRVRHPQKISVHLSPCERVGHPPSSNRAGVHSGAARKGPPPASKIPTATLNEPRCYAKGFATRRESPRFPHSSTRFSRTNCSRSFGSTYGSLVPHFSGLTSPVKPLSQRSGTLIKIGVVLSM
jgi:hypothetical protein